MLSDKSRFYLHHADGRVIIYRRRNERYAQNFIREIYPYGGGGVMVRAAINSNFISALKARLLFVMGILTRDVTLIKFFDLTLCLCSVNVRNLHSCMAYRHNNKIPVLPWPAQSCNSNNNNLTMERSPSIIREQLR